MPRVQQDSHLGLPSWKFFTCHLRHPSVVHFFNTHLSGAHHVASTMLGAGDTVGNETLCKDILCHQMVASHGKVCVGGLYKPNCISELVVFSFLH